MAKHNATGRRSTDGKYVQLGEWLLGSPAWKHATVYERALYIEIKRRYNGSNNGNIPLSHREAGELLGCSNKPVLAAFKGLQDKGFIKPKTLGFFNWKASPDGAGRSTRWELTECPLDVPVRVLSGGTKDFLKWSPPGTEKKSRYAQSTPMVCPEHTISETVVRPRHTIREVAYALGTR